MKLKVYTCSHQHLSHAITLSHANIRYRRDREVTCKWSKTVRPANELSLNHIKSYQSLAN